jgi:hypothetical protein
MSESEGPKPKVYKIKKIPLERRLLWARWDKIVNMTGAEIRTFRQSEEGQKVGWSSDQAKRGSISGISGHEASKIIEGMLSKAGRFRGQQKRMPPWSPEEWKIANKQVAYISRARSNTGPLLNDDDEKTPKAMAMMIWGRDEIRASGSFPDKEKLKEQLVKQDFNENYIDQANQLLD